MSTGGSNNASPMTHRSPSMRHIQSELDHDPDLLDRVAKAALSVAVGERDAQSTEKISGVLQEHAVDFSSALTDEQVVEISKTCLYKFYEEGCVICAADEETELCAPPPTRARYWCLSPPRLCCLFRERALPSLVSC